MAKIQAISFDGDGTLWDFTKVMRHSLEIVLKHMQAKYGSLLPPYVDVPYLIAIRNQIAAQYQGKIINLEEIRRLAFVETLSKIGLPNERYASELNSLYLHHRFEDIELYPDVMPLLKSIKGKFKIALLSNGNGYPRKCRLEDVFDVVVFAQDYGFEKPDTRLFKVTFDKLQFSPQQIIHIGDSLKDDYQGAKAAGAIGIWLNRTRKPIPESCHKYVYDLEAIRNWLIEVY